jgi:hypothetical protein
MTLAVKSMIGGVNAASGFAPCGRYGATDRAFSPLRGGVRSIRKEG